MTAANNFPLMGPGAPRAFAYPFIALSVYIAMTHVFEDPFPSPVLEVAGTLLVGLLLAGQIWSWVLWVQAKGERAPFIHRALWTAAAALFGYSMFKLALFDPFPGLLGRILLFSTLPALLAASAWSISASRDEVYRASVFEGYTWGTFIGLGLTVTGLFIMRISPELSDQLQTHALTVTNGLSPAAVGFGIGVIYSIMMISLCLAANQAVWWMRRR